MKNNMIQSFFTSGWQFSEDENELKNKFQMINAAFLLSSAGLLFGITTNILRGTPALIPIETILLAANVILCFVLRVDKQYFRIVSWLVTLQFTFLFLFLVYVSKPEELKHIWIFTYPIVLLFFKNEKNAVAWVGVLIFFLMIAPLQPFVKVEYSLFQVTYISFVLLIVSIIIYFYQKRMDEARNLIIEQKNLLTQQLDELKTKDKILSLQSKQAVMGEMISMIAHQWRQPLSTVTLHISSLQLKRMLGEDIESKEFDKAFENINETVVYLSDTINDFQTYFHPNKKISTITIAELIEKAVNFIKPRLKESKIEIVYDFNGDGKLETYANEIIQVLLNILNNAVDELLKNNIQNPRIAISVQNSKHETHIRIEDNAGGIAQKDLSMIFEPYFSTKGKNGTGLGLYMSQMIMQKQFQSSIEVQSIDDMAVFYLKVPKKLA